MSDKIEHGGKCLLKWWWKHSRMSEKAWKGYIPCVVTPEMPDGWNFPYAITCVPATFARFLVMGVGNPGVSSDLP